MSTEAARVCPRCGSRRPIAEIYCENEVEGRACDYYIVDEPIVGASAPSVAPTVCAHISVRRCQNGHEVSAGDLICVRCGAALRDTSEPTGSTEPTPSYETIDNWIAAREVRCPDDPWQRFEVQDAAGQSGVLTLFATGFEPDPNVQDIVRRLPREHVPEVLAVGRFHDRSYEVVERFELGDLSSRPFTGNDLTATKQLVEQISRALAELGAVNLRHRDLRPSAIHIRGSNPLDLVISSFAFARQSDFDLESITPLKLTRYSAPETIGGGTGAASDWWSVGVIVLEQVTKGACFEGVNEKAFLIHVVTRGISIPDNLDPQIHLLLRGLLARDPLKRWGAGEVRSWLVGEQLEAPEEARGEERREQGPAISLAGQQFTRPEDFALAAAHADHWIEARAQALRGDIATWLDARAYDAKKITQIRHLSTDEGIDEDCRLALILMTLNPSLPFALRGDVVNAAWLLSHADEGYSIVLGEVPRQLERMGRANILVRLRARLNLVQERAKLLEIPLDQNLLRTAALASSRSNLEAERTTLRKIYPDTDHPSLAALLDRPRIGDEDLIVLIAAERTLWMPIAALVQKTKEVASLAKVPIKEDSLGELLVKPRREIFALIETRTANFARCGNARVDEWVEQFRTEKRLSLERAVTILSVPEREWKQPPKQEYVSNLLKHFEKRVSGSVQRGPLVRFILGKTTPRVDVKELETTNLSAEKIINHIIDRTEAPISLDPLAFVTNPTLEQRLRHLVNHASTFRRDTGIDGRRLGFPFLLFRDQRSAASQARPRIAPVLLWPISVEIDVGSRTTKIAFDQRDEVRLNPALEGLLGRELFAKWNKCREELLARARIRVGDLLDAFEQLSAPQGASVVGIPSKDIELEHGTKTLVLSAGLFNAEFTGQSISEDLRALAHTAPAGTALEAVLRLPQEAPPRSKAPEPLDGFLTVESDPSQEEAVARARLSPGLLIEGPPGTGKSQTIVNIVCDTIGRGESVLIVCQKQAAIKVVQKRLEAEGLGDRLFNVTDVVKDREPILRALRDQIARGGADTLAQTKQRRRRNAHKIAELESEVDQYYEALYDIDEAAGMSYRGVLADLISVEDSADFINVTKLRRIFAKLDRGQIDGIEEVCGSLAKLWLESGYEVTPLKVLLPFSADDIVRQELECALLGFVEVETARRILYDSTSPSFETEDPDPITSWLKSHREKFADASKIVREGFARWLDLFETDDRGNCGGNQMIKDLREIANVLAELDTNLHSADFFSISSGLEEKQLGHLLKKARSATATPTFANTVLLTRIRARRSIDAFLRKHQFEGSQQNRIRFRDALLLENALRPLRRAKDSIWTQLKLSPEEPRDIFDLRRIIAFLLSVLESVRDAAQAVFTCPRSRQARLMAKAATREAFDGFERDLTDAVARSRAREKCRQALENLQAWFEPAWLDQIRKKIDSGEVIAEDLDVIRDRLPTLESFQRFRIRANTFDKVTRQVFANLREHEAVLSQRGESGLDRRIRHSIRREWLLACKSRLESELPTLTMDGDEISDKVQKLAEAEAEQRKLNRKLLADDVGRAGNHSDWEDITRLRGPRAKRLREVLHEGKDLGLLRLRPIWLLNPEVASRVLPRREKFFDLLIFDEASQMLVEHALPTLFRAKRVVVSGDEKQMPPSHFFATRIDSDEEEQLTDQDEDDFLSERERAAAQEGLNRREIKDCPDLLHLGREVLPATSLLVHYRSQYRELIGYSNAAFYQGNLSIPARHPDAEVLKARPIEVLQVGGTYSGQTNKIEAQRVVAELRKIWERPGPNFPTVGVVTFNRKQSDLVEDAIEEFAEEDTEFRAAFTRERDRVEDGEDVGFFVKNVENVQGDERDIIIFSTTFGRDENGVFKKNFGVLGQTGGEHRLNVAITRAKSKVIIVSSMPIGEIAEVLAERRRPSRPRDFLQTYLDYAIKIDAGRLDEATDVTKRLSREQANVRLGEQEQDGFVSSVGEFIRQLGYEPISLSDGDAFGLDFAIKNAGTGLYGLGIECDAPRHKLLTRARAREVWRRNVLQRGFPKIHRISSQAWYRNRTKEKDALQKAIKAGCVER